MEPEISRRFDRIEGVLVRLAEAQARTDERLARTDDQIAALTGAQRRTDEQIAALAGEMRELAKAQRRTDERLDRWAQLIIRGNTEAAERHAVVIERLDGLEGTKGQP